MNEQEKSLKLAELMGWELDYNKLWDEWHVLNLFPRGHIATILQPYANSEQGHAQFATILLKFPEVFSTFDCRITSNPKNVMWLNGEKPTQSNILDEILRMNGVSDV